MFPIWQQDVKYKNRKFCCYSSYTKELVFQHNYGTIAALKYNLTDHNNNKVISNI